MGNFLFPFASVIPAKAGIQALVKQRWIPAFAGMTKFKDWICNEHRLHLFD
jgi:hypothetical protein